MGKAFDAAYKGLHDTGQPALVREIMARRIVKAASNRQTMSRDPQRGHRSLASSRERERTPARQRQFLKKVQSWRSR